jgi:hypothetical protein
VNEISLGKERKLLLRRKFDYSLTNLWQIIPKLKEIIVEKEI